MNIRVLNINKLATTLAVILLLAGVTILSSCACCNNDKEPEKLLYQDHVLVNRIWDVGNRQFINKDALLKHALNSKYLLLGETHDNISHHRHQAEVIADLQQSRRNASVHFEMIDDEQSERLNKSGFSGVDELIEILDQTSTGWQYDKMYRVVFEQALAAQYKILPANLPHGLIRTIFSEGKSQVPEAVKNVLNAIEMTELQRLSLQKEILEGHCNVMPDHMLEPMMLTQRVRDARMTLGLIQSNAETRVLITGNGHARNDRGVPVYLRTQDKEGRIVSVAFIEVEQNRTQPVDYNWRWDNDVIPFDYVWFTPRYDRPDPCEGLKEHFNNKVSE